MEIKQLEVYSEAPIVGIVKMPGRAFPGVVIQGDSLSILVSSIQEIATQIKLLNSSELEQEVSLLQQQLVAYQEHYEQVLKAHNMSLPYFKAQET